MPYSCDWNLDGHADRVDVDGHTFEIFYGAPPDDTSQLRGDYRFGVAETSTDDFLSAIELGGWAGQGLFRKVILTVMALTTSSSPALRRLSRRNQRLFPFWC